MRLFIALPIPQNLKEEIRAYQYTLRDLPLRFTPPENLHVTLVFLGEIPEEEIPQIQQTIQSVIHSLKATSYKLQAKVFEPGPNPRHPRLVWLTLKASPDLYSLQKDLAHVLQREEVRPFTAHITIARVTYNAHLNPNLVPIKILPTDFTFSLGKVHLMESKLLRGGAQYSIVKTFPL